MIKLTDASGFAWVIRETEILHADAVSGPRADHHLTRTRNVRQVFLIGGFILNTEASDKQVQESPREKLECRHERCISAVCR